MIIDLIVICVSLFLLAKQFYENDWVAVISFLCVMLVLYLCRQPNYISIGVAAIVLTVIVMSRIESFEEEKESKKKTIKFNKKPIKSKKYEENDNEDEDEDDEDDEDDDEGEEDDDEGEEEDEKDDDEIEDQPEIDIGQTFRNAYKNLNPDQIENMTKDTQDLVKTQSNLISTLQNLEPVVKQGISLLDKFQGEGNTAKMFKDMAKKANIKNVIKK